MKMEKYNLVPRAKKSIEDAIEIANKNKHQKVNSAHLFYALLDNGTIAIKNILNHFKINVDALKNCLVIELPTLESSFFKKAEKTEDWWSEDLEFSLRYSYELSKDLDQEFIGVEHVIYGIFKRDSFLRNYLISKEVPVEEIADAILQTLHPTESGQDQPQQEKEKSDPSKKEQGKFVEKYCNDLTKLVLKLDSKINGRDSELDKLIEVLSCKVKNNAILVGDAGVGKTAVVEALAQRINSGECPVFFAGFKIYSLDLSALVAGTKYRGQFEERFKGLIDELKEDPHAILFIDEIHSIVGTGSNEGSLDLANMIKPPLARGEIKCIGATTHAEYKKYFEKDSALNRRFQLINIDEPNKKQTFEILKKAKVSYEMFHGVTYDDEIINNIIELSDKYLPYRRFPDKAFDILDRIGAKGKLIKYEVPDNIKKIEEKLLSYMDKTDLSSDIEKQKCEKKLQEYLTKRNVWIKKTSENLFKIENDHIFETFSKISGLDKEKLKIGSANSVLSLKEEINELVVDQEEVINKIYEILLCAKAGIKKRKKTLANLLFIGSTGVGKTYTAKIIAEKFFNKPNSFLQIDMAEFVDKNSVSKLLGATAGYVGYEEGGLLSEFVRNNPFSLILFDEVEKAHPDVVNILLKIMDEGIIIDNFNRKIDFTNTIIVMTGNIGAETETSKSMGFVVQKTTETRKNDYENSLKKTFKPELISRLDEVLIFNNKFSKDGLIKMICFTLDEIKNSLSEKNIKFNKNQELLDHLYNLIEKDGNNARAVQKVLRNKFELPLCKFIVGNENLEEISFKVVDNELVFV
jgi:ATP-dependent Clp protease ATP-binding subunit ClpC